MPKITETKVGRVFLKQIEPGRWRADFREPVTKQRKRIVLPVTTFREAKEQAQDINLRIASGKGFNVRLRGSVGHTVSDAVLEAIKHSNANRKTRTKYSSLFNAFGEYLNKFTSGIRAWGEVTEQILENYLEYCRRQGVSHDTVRLRMHVLRMTSRYMNRVYPDQYRNVAKDICVRDLSTPDLADGAQQILSQPKLRELLDWLQENEPMLFVWGMLQGLCGLRIYEAAYLREQDISLAEGKIIVTESSAHKPKTRTSYRVLPICGAVASALSDWISKLRIRHPEGFIFCPDRTTRNWRNARSEAARIGVYTMDRISHVWTAGLRKAKRSGMSLPDKFVARKLRANFATGLLDNGVDFAVVQKYVGQSPNSVLRKHYHIIRFERMKIVSKAAQDLYDGTGVFQEKENVQEAVKIAM